MLMPASVALDTEDATERRISCQELLLMRTLVPLSLY
jgi:hypothetical protein